LNDTKLILHGIIPFTQIDQKKNILFFSGPLVSFEKKQRIKKFIFNSTLAIFQFYLILEPQGQELFHIELYDINSMTLSISTLIVLKPLF